MRRFFFLLTILSSFLLSAFFVINSIFERIGLDEEEAKKSLLTNLLGTFDKAYRPVLHLARQKITVLQM